MVPVHIYISGYIDVMQSNTIHNELQTPINKFFSEYLTISSVNWVVTAVSLCQCGSWADLLW